MKRRNVLQGAVALGVAGSLAGCAVPGLLSSSRGKVVVVGGGYGGATAAKYLRMWSGYKTDVVLIEPNASFVSCPLSNLVLGGFKTMNDITLSYAALAARHGVTVVRNMVATIDTAKKTLTLAGGASMAWDKLVLSPGIDMIWDSVEGLQAANAAGRILQAWKAGPETLALRRQLEAMPDGGVFAITVPEVPYRCPPGPYERASLAAAYFKKAKPRSKVLILDANPDLTSKGALFRRFWADNYRGMIEYRPQHKAVAVHAASMIVNFEVQDDVKADVLNVLPSMSAGGIAIKTGLANSNARWCNVDFRTFESTAAKDIHVIGDAIQVASGMPKSGHMANAHAKVVAAALLAQLGGTEVDPQPMLTNTCYSYVDEKLAMHVASVHLYDAAEKTFKTVPGSGGLSSAANELEGVYGWNWAQNIWADSLA